MMTVGPGLGGTSKAMLPEIVRYLVGERTCPACPFAPPPRVDGMDAAFSTHCWNNAEMERYVGLPTIGTTVGWANESRMASVDGAVASIVLEVVLLINT